MVVKDAYDGFTGESRQKFFFKDNRKVRLWYTTFVKYDTRNVEIPGLVFRLF